MKKKTERKLGIALIIAPFAGFIVTIFSYSILAFIFQSVMEPTDATGAIFSFARILLGFLGLASALGIFVCIPIGIYLLVKKK